MTTEVNFRDISDVTTCSEIFNTNQNINALKIVGCPTKSAAHNLLAQNWFQEEAENTLSLNEIIFVITEGVSDNAHALQSSFINKNFMISFEVLNVNSFEVCWTINGNFHKINLTKFDVELRNFVKDHVKISLENDNQGKD